MSEASNEPYSVHVRLPGVLELGESLTRFEPRDALGRFRKKGGG